MERVVYDSPKAPIPRLHQRARPYPTASTCPLVGVLNAFMGIVANCECAGVACDLGVAALGALTFQVLGGLRSTPASCCLASLNSCSSILFWATNAAFTSA